jgi:hypothetical protein
MFILFLGFCVAQTQTVLPALRRFFPFSSSKRSDYPVFSADKPLRMEICNCTVLWPRNRTRSKVEPNVNTHRDNLFQLFYMCDDNSECRSYIMSVVIMKKTRLHIQSRILPTSCSCKVKSKGIKSKALPVTGRGMLNGCEILRIPH